MRIGIICFVALMLLLLSCKSEPDLIFDNATINLGRLNVGESKGGKFVFLNNSSREVKIEDIAVECDCVVPGKIKGNILPGIKQEIGITFKPTGGMQGIQSRTVIIKTDANPRFYLLTFQAVVAGKKAE